MTPNTWLLAGSERLGASVFLHAGNLHLRTSSPPMPSLGVYTTRFLHIDQCKRRWVPARDRYIWRFGPSGTTYIVLVCELPLWTFLVVLVPLTVILFRRGRRPPPGHCQTCGYNLTGNVSGRCPECGTSCSTG